jgi:hypothetical protein
VGYESVYYTIALHGRGKLPWDPPRRCSPPLGWAGSRGPPPARLMPAQRANTEANACSAPRIGGPLGAAAGVTFSGDPRATVSLRCRACVPVPVPGRVGRLMPTQHHVGRLLPAQHHVGRRNSTGGSRSAASALSRGRPPHGRHRGHGSRRSMEAQQAQRQHWAEEHRPHMTQ